MWLQIDLAQNATDRVGGDVRDNATLYRLSGECRMGLVGNGRDGVAPPRRATMPANAGRWRARGPVVRRPRVRRRRLRLRE
jgi:hypothetical protein